MSYSKSGTFVVMQLDSINITIVCEVLQIQKNLRSSWVADLNQKTNPRYYIQIYNLVHVTTKYHLKIYKVTAVLIKKYSNEIEQNMHS